MKRFLFCVFFLYFSSLSFGVTQVNCDGSQIIYMSYNERDYNGGGQTYVWCDVYQAALLHFPAASMTNMANSACTLYISQFQLDAKPVFDSATGPKLQIYSVPGTWKSGSSRSTVENGAACYNYRAYNTETWGDENAPDIFMYALMNGHANKAKLTLRVPSDHNGLCYAVLDSEIVNALANGTVGGLFIVNFQTSQVNLNFTRTVAALPHLSYGIPVGVESTPHRTISEPLHAQPNPFSVSTTFWLDPSFGEEAKLSIYSPTGKLVYRTHAVKGGLVQWAPESFLGNGLYILQADCKGKRYAKTVVLQR